MRFRYNAPPAVTASLYGEVIGWYTDCDTAVCRDCEPLYASGDFSTWGGFEGWEEPAAIFYHSESDSVTFCARCSAVIKHDLTTDGTVELVTDLAGFLSEGELTYDQTGREEGSPRADAMAQKWDAYRDTLCDSDLEDIIVNAMILAGCREAGSLCRTSRSTRSATGRRPERCNPAPFPEKRQGMTEQERVPVGTIVAYHGSVFTKFTLYTVRGYCEDVAGQRPDLPADVIAGEYPGNFAYSLFPVGVPFKMDNQYLSIDYVRRSSFDVLGTLVSDDKEEQP